jgi:hypothetical protein
MSWVDKVETGQRGLVRLPMLEAVATALQVDVAAITDDEVARAAARGPDAVEVRAIRAALGSYQAILGGGEPVDLAQLQSQVDYACSAWLSAHFSTIGRILPKLILDAQTAADRLSGPCRLAATRCLVMVYRLASSTLLKFETAEVAWLAADRAMLAARLADDPICLARATRSVARAMAAAGQHRDAIDVLVAFANRMEPDLAGDDRQLLSLYGMLLLPAEIAAARDGDATTALTMHAEADQIASRLGPGYDDPVNVFGVTNVAVHRLSALVRLQEGRRAVGFAATIDGAAVARLPSERKAAYLLDLAEAHRQCRQHREAAGAVVRAEQIAPEEVRCRPAAHTLVRRLLDVTSGQPAIQLRQLAERAGVSG